MTAREPSPVDFDVLLGAMPREVMELDCGCGSPWQWAREGETVLDLGCGAGKACFLASRAVGHEGCVIGVDASERMIAVARRHQAALAERIGWANVRFEVGRIEELGAVVVDASVDLVVMDCVATVLQARDRPAAFAQARRVLRPGGRAIVCDVLADDLEGMPEALATAGFGSAEVLERSDAAPRVIDGRPRRATTLRAFLSP